MAAKPSSASKSIITYKLKKIFVPMLIGSVLGLFTFYGGEAYQQIGLEGLGTARIVFGYIIGISEFLVVAVILQRLVQNVILDWLFASAFGSTAPRLLSQISSFFIYLIAITAIIGVVFKKDLTVMLAASGAAGIVVGMALRELILDIFAGLALNLDRTIKIGDSIKLKLANVSIEGTVKEISWRTTQVLTKYYNTVIIPNSKLSSVAVVNYSLPKPFLKAKMPVTLDFSIPTERAVRILQAAALEVSSQFSSTDAPAPSITIEEINKSGIRYIVAIYPTFETSSKAKNITYQAILRHLDCAGLIQSLDKSETIYIQTEADSEVGTQPNPIQLAKLIGEVSLFKDFTDADKQKLTKLAPLRKVKADVFVTHAGEVATSMFLLVEGLLLSESIQRGKGGKTVITKVINPGTLIGGEVMLLGSTYELTIKARTASLLCEINQQTLGSLLSNQSELAHKLSKRVAKQVTIKNDQTESNNQQQWHMSEADLTVEVYRNLQRLFSL